MKNRTKFIKMFKKLPEKARRELVLNAYSNKPLSLNIVYMEVKNNTELGEECLIALGYEDNSQQRGDLPTYNGEGDSTEVVTSGFQSSGVDCKNPPVDNSNKKNTLKGSVFCDGERNGS